MARLFRKDGTPTFIANRIAHAIVKAQDGSECLSGTRLRLKSYRFTNGEMRLYEGYHVRACKALDNAGIRYTEGNDYPYGQKHGDYIELSHDDANLLWLTLKVRSIKRNH